MCSVILSTIWNHNNDFRRLFFSPPPPTYFQNVLFSITNPYHTTPALLVRYIWTLFCQPKKCTGWEGKEISAGVVSFFRQQHATSYVSTCQASNRTFLSSKCTKSCYICQLLDPRTRFIVSKEWEREKVESLNTYLRNVCLKKTLS